MDEHTITVKFTENMYNGHDLLEVKQHLFF